MKLENWEHEPLWLKLLTPYLKKKRFPYLDGTPEAGKWYRLPLKDCFAADGEPSYADFQLGTEDRLLIFFCGGGVSWNAHTAARPVSVYQKNALEGFYMIHVDLFTDLTVRKGIFEDSPRNPFRNWSKLMLVYNTGDFHIGDGDFPYTALDGSQRICRHRGYHNYREAMRIVSHLLPDPQALLVAGCSGGGFGAALLCDDVMSIYPSCENVTCLVDSGFSLMDGWSDIARNVWHAPKEIVARINSDNITLDALRALHQDHKGKVKILFCCSIRDSALSRMENYIRDGQLDFSSEGGDRFEADLKAMCHKLSADIPSAGLYIFDLPDKSQKANTLTTHCMIGESTLYEYSIDNVNCVSWISEAVNGCVKNYACFAHSPIRAKESTSFPS